MRGGPRLGGVTLLFVTSTVACGLTIAGAIGDDPDGDGRPEQDAALDPPNATDGEGGNTGDILDAGDAGSESCEAGATRACTPANPQCGPGTQTCVDGVFGRCVAPSPSSETCNGMDDDCNDVVDDPCPTGVALGGTVASSPMWGSDSGPNAYDDTCPAGEALIGVSVRMQQYMRSIRGHCGAITIVEDESTTPYGYTLTVRPGTVLEERGTVDGGVSSVECPPDTVVVSVSGRAGAWVDQIALHCAPLSLTTGPGPSFALTIGSVTATRVAGGIGGSPVPRFDCPAGSFLNRLRGSTGAYVDNVTFSCATPSIIRKGS